MREVVVRIGILLVKINQERANALELGLYAVVSHPGSKGDHCCQDGT